MLRPIQLVTLLAIQFVRCRRLCIVVGLVHCGQYSLAHGLQFGWKCRLLQCLLQCLLQFLLGGDASGTICVATVEWTS